MDQRVMDHKILRTEQLRDRRQICRMTADEHDAIVDAMQCGEFALKLAVDRTLTRDQSARRRGGSVTFDGRRRSSVDVGMAGKSEIVVARVVQEDLAVDDGRGAGDALVRTEIGIRYPESRRTLG